MDCWIQAWQAIELENHANGLLRLSMLSVWLWAVTIQTQLFWKSVFNVFSQIPKRRLVCLLLWTYVHEKAISFRESSPIWSPGICDPGPRWGVCLRFPLQARAPMLAMGFNNNLSVTQGNRRSLSGEWVSVYGLTSHSTHNRSFRGRVFPGNQLHRYWQPKTIRHNTTLHYIH